MATSKRTKPSAPKYSYKQKEREKEEESSHDIDEATSFDSISRARTFGETYSGPVTTAAQTREKS
jgi:hypothetical protein